MIAPHTLTSASMTRYGSAYFLSSSVRMKKLVVPQYSICAMRSSAAAECSTGMEVRRRMELKMKASRRVQVRLWQRGRRRPCAGEGGRGEEDGKS